MSHTGKDGQHPGHHKPTELTRAQMEAELAAAAVEAALQTPPITAREDKEVVMPRSVGAGTARRHGFSYVPLKNGDDLPPAEQLLSGSGHAANHEPKGHTGHAERGDDSERSRN